MTRRAGPSPPKPPDFPPERTYAALQKQLAALDGLRGRNHEDAGQDEREWKNLTLHILIHGFGEGNAILSQFHSTKWAGEHSVMGMTERSMQRNFEKRIEAFAAMLRSSLSELELMMAQAEISGAYEPGGEYQFDRDLKAIVGFATSSLFVIDSDLDTQLFGVYMGDVGPAVSVRVLSNEVREPLRAAAEKFAKRGSFELRSSKDVHDRVVFANERCWVIGQSIKDAAKKKPTYIVEHSGAASMKGIYDSIWASAVTLVKA